MSKTLTLAAVALACVAAVPASAAVKISCYRGPIPESSFINGANKVFIQSIHETYDVTLDEARSIANSVCSDMSAVEDKQRMLEIAKSRLAGLRPR